ncbi:MAG: methionine synthase [Actinobacteria bacterium]|nr:methionine synthase [Actinomycetota bacterium]
MKKILGACIGSCVHVAGILNFLNLAGRIGYRTKFAGSAMSIDDLKSEFDSFKPDILAVSYRLSPESITPVFKELKEKITSSPEGGKAKFILGTTGPVAKVAREARIFDKIFTGEESREDIEEYLGSERTAVDGKIPPQDLLGRISFKKPFPVIRHHFGRPTMKETIEGIKKISLSGVLDIISIGPDQNTQEHFFNPRKMNPSQDGAGGVPVRSEEDFKKLYLASRTGNYPLLRCYSGTNDIVRMAEVLHDNINNAWCAVPLCWYNELDNRSSRKLTDSIRENQFVMKWHADRGIPVEVNESHHWSLRYAPDSIAVAAAFLAAFNAKKMGVKTYISQYMFNTPPETSFKMDLAKMLAKVEMVETLHDENFTSLRQTRTGLYSFPTDFNKGMGQLASSTLLQMQLDPGIVHVVAFCESDHAAKPGDIIESTKIAGKVIENYIYGCPDMKSDSEVIERKKQLIHDASLILEKIKGLDREGRYSDPLTSPGIISEAIKLGILDAPHLCGIKAASGKIMTGIIDGKNVAVGPDLKPLDEEERLAGIGTA